MPAPPRPHRDIPQLGLPSALCLLLPAVVLDGRARMMAIERKTALETASNVGQVLEPAPVRGEVIAVRKIVSPS